MTAPIKGSSGDNKNRSVDEQREEQCNSRVDCTEEDCLPLTFRCRFEMARLRNRRMENQIMRHDRGTKNPDCHIEHLAVVQDVRRRYTPQRHRSKAWLGQKDLNREAHANYADKSEHQGFDQTKSFVLQIKNCDHVARC